MSENKKIAKKYDKSKSKKPYQKGNVKNQTLDNPNTGKGSSKDNPKRGDRINNDPSWYDLNPQSTKDTASIRYNRATGLEWKMTRSPLGLTNPVTPGILGFGIAMDPMSSNKYDDPINVCARQIVSNIRSVNSGATNYDPNDFMIRLLGQAALLGWLSFATRAYATWCMYSPVNRYLPDALFKTQFLDPAWFRQHAVDYRKRLNQLIIQISSIIYVPEQISLLRRYSWLFRNYYCDSESAKDQLYVTFPTRYHVYEIDPNTQMGMLKSYQWAKIDSIDMSGEMTPHLYTGDDVLNVLESMLEPFVEDQDLCIINGDLMKYYGPSRLTFGLLSDIEITQPVYAPDVLWQLRNSRTLPDITSYNWNDVVQDAAATYLTRGGAVGVADSFLYKWYEAGVETSDSNTGWFNRALSYYWSDLIVDTDKLDPDPQTNMENTRLSCIATGADALNHEMEFAKGPDVIEFYVMCYRRSGANGMEDKFIYFKSMICSLINMLSSTGPGSMYAEGFTSMGYIMADQLIAYLSAFEYHPMVYNLTEIINRDANNNIVYNILNISEPLMTQNNLGFVSSEVLDSMNYTAMISLLGIKGPSAY